MEKEKIEQIIDETIIAKLKENNIFEKFMTVEEIRAKLIEMVQDIEFGDLGEYGVEGRWEPFEGKIILPDKYENEIFSSDIVKYFLTHELLHALSTPIEENIEYKTGIVRFGYGRGLNEGVTEWLTQKLYSTDRYNHSIFRLSFDISGVYPLQQCIIQQLATLYGEEKIIDGYLNNHMVEADIAFEVWREFEENIDHILDKENHIGVVEKGRIEDEMSDDEVLDILSAKLNIEETFIDSQEIFLKKLLLKEIQELKTLEQAEELKVKLRKLNLLNVKIKGSKELDALDIKVEKEYEVNYEKYNFIFIRKYLQIVNQNKSFEEQIKFDEVEKYLIDSQYTKAEHEKQDAETILIENESKERMYLRECGKETVGGEEIHLYEYFAEEDVIQYKDEKTDTKGKILKGKIDLARVKEDEEYAKAIADKLLVSKAIVEQYLINFNGYIGYLDDNLCKQMDSEVMLRLGEEEKYIRLNIKGLNTPIYLCEKIDEVKIEGVNSYLLLTEDEVNNAKTNGIYNESQSFKGNIDFLRLMNDKKYLEFIENDFLTSDRLQECSEKFDGYFGEVIDTGIGFEWKNSHIEEFATVGANGEEKKEMLCEKGDGYEDIHWYIDKDENTIGQDVDGNNIYRYEFIDSTEMKKMWEDENYKSSPNREKYNIIGTEEEVSYLPYDYIIKSIVYKGGYVGFDQKLIEQYSKQSIELYDGNIILWKNENNVFLSKKDKEFETKEKISCDVDVERMNNDLRYKRYIMKNVLTPQYINNIFPGDFDDFAPKGGKLSWVRKKKRDFSIDR